MQRRNLSLRIVDQLLHLAPRVTPQRVTTEDLDAHHVRIEVRADRRPVQELHVIAVDQSVHHDFPVLRKIEDMAFVEEPLVETILAQRRSEEHTSELPSLMRISYAVFCFKKKTYIHNKTRNH